MYARVQFRTTAYGQANTQVRLERVDDASYQPVGYPPVWLAIGNTSAVARLIELPSNLEPGQYVLRGHLQYVTSLRHYEADWLTKEFTVEAR